MWCCKCGVVWGGTVGPVAACAGGERAHTGPTSPAGFQDEAHSKCMASSSSLLGPLHFSMQEHAALALHRLHLLAQPAPIAHRPSLLPCLLFQHGPPHRTTPHRPPQTIRIVVQTGPKGIVRGLQAADAVLSLTREYLQRGTVDPPERVLRKWVCGASAMACLGGRVRVPAPGLARCVV